MSATDKPERQQRSLARELGLLLPKLESLRVRTALGGLDLDPGFVWGNWTKWKIQVVELCLGKKMFFF